MFVWESEYTPGETVYLKTDPERLPRIITALEVRGETQVSYFLASGLTNSWHFAMEIVTEKSDCLIKEEI